MNVNKQLVPGNYTAGRQGQNVRYIILHTMVGYIDGADSRFRNPATQVSTHYGIGEDGEVRQWVEEQNTAYGCGSWSYNLQSINIEHEDKGNYNDPTRTDALYNSSIELCADICRRYNLPADRSTFKLHKEVIDTNAFPGGTACPDALDVDRIINGVATALAPPPVAPQPVPTAQSVYTRFDVPMNLVANKQPTNVYNLDGGSWGVLSASVVKTLNQGDPFVAVGKAQHPLGGVYFMTDYSFGNADTTGKPAHNNGVNTVDVSPPNPVAATAPTEATAAPITVTTPTIASSSPAMSSVTPVAPVEDISWQETTKNVGDYRAKKDVTLHSLLKDGNADLDLPVGPIVHIAETFANGKYARTVKAKAEGWFYDMEMSNLELVKAIDIPEDDTVFDDIARDMKAVLPTIENAAKVVVGSIKTNKSFRDKLVALVARIVFRVKHTEVK